MICGDRDVSRCHFAYLAIALFAEPAWQLFCLGRNADGYSLGVVVLKNLSQLLDGGGLSALLQDDLALATPPGPHKGKPIAFVDVFEESLAMPEEGDKVRAIVARTARDLGLDLKITYEVRSISAMKSLVARASASSVLALGGSADLTHGRSR